MANLINASLCIGFVAFTCLFGNSGAATAQDEIPILIAKNDPTPYARLVDAAPVEGARIVVGLMRQKERIGNKTRVIAEIPDSWVESEACARLVSPDALFEAQSEYDIPIQIAGSEVQLELELKDQDVSKLAKRGMDQVAVTVTKGRCSDPESEFVLASTIDAGSESDDTLTLFVNGQGASQVFAEVISPLTTESSVLCEDSSEPSSVGYNHICILRHTDFLNLSEVEIRINRFDLGTMERPTDIKLRLLAAN